MLYEILYRPCGAHRELSGGGNDFPNSISAQSDPVELLVVGREV